MALRPERLRWVWLILALAALAGASFVRDSLTIVAKENKLTSDDSVLEQHPEMALARVAPGGLRPLLVNYFWIRSQQLHQDGQHFDAMQLADIICNLQPRFPSVWGFQSWQMAWNISVTTHTPEERWHWVSRGIELLRDKGIPLNPHALLLYKDLGWIFAAKMGDGTDEMHRVYKARWAYEFQKLLGSPVQKKSADLLAAFKQIVDAPVDKNLARRGRNPIQADKLAELIKDPAIAGYVERLKANNTAVQEGTDEERDDRNIEIDESLLAAYSRYSIDPAVTQVRIRLPQYTDERDRKLWMVINNPKFAAPRAKLLAFVRAQILWNVYKMDPAFMYKMMEDVGPIDWRHVWSHGMYWSAYGTYICRDQTSKKIDWLNTDRTQLNCLKYLTFLGRMVYMENLSNETQPEIRMFPDWRFMDATHDEFFRLGKLAAEARNREFKKNSFAAGHINYIANAIALLVSADRYDKARTYIKWVRENYGKTKDQWAIDDPEEFVLYKYRKDPTPIPRMAQAYMSASLQRTFIAMLSGNEEQMNRKLAFARKVYKAYHTGARKSKRLRLPPISKMGADALWELLVAPQRAGYRIHPQDCAALYRMVLERWPEVAAYVYRPATRRLRPRYEFAKMDFDKLFPKPAGYDANIRKVDRAVQKWRSGRRRPAISLPAQ